MKIKKLLPCLLAFAAIPAFADASTAIPKKAGPVSYYGALHTSGGKIIGAKNNKEAMLRGVSLFWSDATGLPYYNKNVIEWTVDNFKIDVFRFAMGITYYNSQGSATEPLDQAYAYATAPTGYMNYIDLMVEAAIENDVYIILDWHSHRADAEQAIAKEFFKTVAAKYAKVPNVIFEIFNEPVNQGWSTIQGYANAVIPGIRASTENLVLVGTPSWSQMTQYGGVSGTNVGYVLHFYAGSHSAGQYGGRATQAKSSGNAVFITEWGTTNADGAGSPQSGSTQEWLTFMDNNNISNCNWSLRQVNSAYNDKSETSAIFDGSTELTTKTLLNNATLSTSGKMVVDYLKKNAQDWTSKLVEGKNTGACAFKAKTAKVTDGIINNAIVAGCSYTSSNEKVAVVSGNDIIINGDGIAIFTGNDGSESVVTISPVPDQTITGFYDLTCSYSGTCSMGRTLNFEGTGTAKQWPLTVDTKTIEGSTYSLTSLNPDIVAVKRATCNNSACSSTMKGKQVTMYEFKSFGTAKIVATAPVVAGYKPMNDTITVTYKKGSNKMTNNFKNTKLAFGESAPKLMPDTTMYHTPVTYTYNGQPTTPYATKQGNALVAGNQNAVLRIVANADETEFYIPFQYAITVVIGDSASAVNLAEYNTSKINSVSANLPIHAAINNNTLDIACKQAGNIEVSILSVNGQKVMNRTVVGDYASFSLNRIPNGSYLIVVKQDARQLTLKWNKTDK
ncbi:MAG: glycoside hydrolase family 5 protein [Fibrobacter sp.]|nr:glycoside hydrolase family 5 protein [Fibrobacter sp.]